MYIPSYVKFFQARTSTISMPYRVQRIEEIVKQLESGDLKLRVRVLEVISLLEISVACINYSIWLMSL